VIRRSSLHGGEKAGQRGPDNSTRLDSSGRNGGTDIKRGRKGEGQGLKRAQGHMGGGLAREVFSTNTHKGVRCIGLGGGGARFSRGVWKKVGSSLNEGLNSILRRGNSMFWRPGGVRKEGHLLE